MFVHWNYLVEIHNHLVLIDYPWLDYQGPQIILQDNCDFWYIFPLGKLEFFFCISYNLQSCLSITEMETLMFAWFKYGIKMMFGWMILVIELYSRFQKLSQMEGVLCPSDRNSLYGDIKCCLFCTWLNLGVLTCVIV